MMADKQESHADNLALEAHGFHCLHLATSHMQYIARDSHEKTNTHYITWGTFPSLSIVSLLFCVAHIF